MSSPKRATSSEQNNFASRSIGLDGWYVFDGKSIRGPVSDRELAVIDADPVQRRKTQVSREGFQRWYALEEISRLISLNQVSNRPELTDEVQEFKRSYQQKMSQLETLEKSFAVNHKLDSSDDDSGSYRLFNLHDDDDNFQPNAGRISAAEIETGKPQNSHLPKDNFETLLAEATMKGVSGAEAYADLPSDDDMNEEDGASEELAQDSMLVTESAVSSEPAFAKIENFQTDYVVLKGRLRLGQHRSLFLTAFLMPLLSLGLSIWNWYRSAALECAYHLTSNFQRLVPPYFMVMIPGVSCLMFYRMAVLVEEMERQNNYRTTSPALAGMLGLIPPFGILYLQPRINRHWNLHIKSVQGSNPTRGF
jgi:hypothetical protein